MPSLLRPLPTALGLGLALVLGAVGACFTPPSDPVLFSCEFEGDDRCPPDYECRSDNCCHRIGTDADDQLGACALGGNTGMTGTTEMGESGSDSTDETSSDTSG